MSGSSSEEFVSTSRAAELLGITRQAVLKRIQAGSLPGRKVGRNYVIPVSAVRSPLETDPVLADIVERLVAGYAPERVYLFGSKARGEGASESDYDLLLVMPDDAGPEELRAGKAYRELLKGAGASVDVVIMTCGAFEARREVVGSLPNTVATDGILLRAA